MLVDGYRARGIRAKSDGPAPCPELGIAPLSSTTSSTRSGAKTCLSPNPIHGGRGGPRGRSRKVLVPGVNRRGRAARGGARRARGLIRGQRVTRQAGHLSPFSIYPRVRLAKADRDQAERAILSVLTPNQVEKRSQNKAALSEDLERLKRGSKRRNAASVIFRPQVEAVHSFISDIDSVSESDSADQDGSAEVIHYQARSFQAPISDSPESLIQWVEPKSVKVNLDTTTEWSFIFSQNRQASFIEAFEHSPVEDPLLDSTASTISVVVDPEDNISFNNIQPRLFQDINMERSNGLAKTLDPPNSCEKSKLDIVADPPSSPSCSVIEEKGESDDQSSLSQSTSIDAAAADEQPEKAGADPTTDSERVVLRENRVMIMEDQEDEEKKEKIISCSSSSSSSSAFSASPASPLNGQHEDIAQERRAQEEEREEHEEDQQHQQRKERSTESEVLESESHQNSCESQTETDASLIQDEGLSIATCLLDEIIEHVPSLTSSAFNWSTTRNDVVMEDDGGEMDDEDSILLPTNAFIKEELESETEEPSSCKVTKSGRRVIRPFTPDLNHSNRASPMQCPKREIRSATPEDLAEKMRQFEMTSPAAFEEGCMLWARVGSTCFWPCAALSDPDIGIYTRISTKRNQLQREYHVQFYGRPVQRAWVLNSYIMEYEGIEEFHQKTEMIRKKVRGTKHGPKVLRAYIPNGKTAKLGWEEAVEGAEKSLSLSSQERVIQLKALSQELLLKGPRQRFQSGSSTLSGASRKRKRTISGTTVDSSVSEEESLAKKPRFAQADRLIQAIPAETLEAHRRKLKTGFKLFHLANFDRIRAECEDNAETDKKLGKLWADAACLERRFYQEQASNLVHSEQVDDSRSSIQGEDDYVILDSEDEAFNDASSVSSSIRSAKNVVCRQPPTLELIGQWKKENCCMICEEVENQQNDLVRCRGVCGNSFHLSCIQVQTSSKEDWKCSECTSGVHACHICKSPAKQVSRCTSPGCGRFYHLECLRDSGMWPQTRVGDNKFVCPVHMCHTCASTNPKEPFMKYSSRLLKCIRCPTAYHSGDFCVTAGTVQITSTQIVCPKHYTPPANRKSGGSLHVNTNWCFLCSKGGSLICCEKCPASFHTECLQIKPPEGVFVCDSCEVGRMPLYNEVVWVKLGNYRWWPATVLHPAKVPANIEKLPHETGEFPIQFCGSKEYFWINQGRCFLYEDGDAEKIPSDSAKGLNAAYKRGLREAAEAFNVYTKEKEAREAANVDKARLSKSLKPPMYTKIKANRPYGDCPVYTEDASDKTCDCDFEQESPCGPDSECINRYLMVECRPSSCPSKEKCQNQRFTKRLYPKLTVGLTQGRGWALVVGEDVKKGDFIIEYVGELITQDEFQRRLQSSLQRKAESNFYYMTMDNHRMIDAGPKGNMSRFMNHSCDPNCETQKWTVNGDTRVGLFAKENIKSGSELTFNYQFEAVGEVKTKCLCGAKNCSGFIGEKPKDGKSVLTIDGRKKKKAKIKKPKKVWEDLCFRCMDDGQLLMCDYKTCPKVYHLECLGREKMPREKWFCPWHHCVHCGKPAVNYCMHCPNAYCKTHDMAVNAHEELGNICDEHEDDLDDLLAFYRSVGGVTKLVPHPNVTPEETAADQVVTNGGKTPLTEIHSSNCSSASDENSSALIFPLIEPDEDTEKAERKSQTKRYLCKCIEDGCEWEGKKSRFLDHLMKRHELPLDVSQAKVRQVLNGIVLQDYPDENGDSSLLSASYSDSILAARLRKGKERLKICPDPACRLKMRASNIARHIKTRHPHLDESLANSAQYADMDDFQSDLDLTLNMSNQSRVSNGFDQSGPVAKTPGKERLKVCPVSGCNLNIRASNLVRHIKTKHPEVDESISLKATYADQRPRTSFTPQQFVTPNTSALNLSEVSNDSTDKFGKERMFTCKYCGVQMRASNLGRHIKARHEREDGSNPIYISPPETESGRRMQVRCPACNLILRPSNFNRHWARRHPAQPLPDVRERRQMYIEADEAEIDDTDDGLQNGESGMGAISVEPVFYGEANVGGVPFEMDDEEGSLEDITFDDDYDARNGPVKYSTPQMNAQSSQLNLSGSSSKHIPASMRELKYRCDTCGYVSRFRQNLDRHCKKRTHYSEYLLRTSKNPHVYVQTPDQAIQDVPPSPAKLPPPPLSQRLDLVEDEDQMMMLTPQVCLEGGASEEEDDEELEEIEDDIQADPVVDNNDLEQEESQPTPEEEQPSRPQPSPNKNDFCNFDLNGILGDSSSEDDDDGIINVDYKIL
ncbi:uncharacterized protein LOC131878504 isoform X2 [Tigriopus californicus]|uniref:uncharacterized protein LOC131878504 isoform X2 n=1 Tax=Tigriopus californicus TaxID=6832 RepID=UPI0027D9F0DE|nr:uncharacterized protein LOC131878504 isoform X2 [Tigriopus californicus]